MATPEIFARRIRSIARIVEDGADRLVVETAVAVNQAVVIATPVDTGRARANWQVGIGVPVRSTTLEEDKGGQATMARNTAKIRARKAGRDIIIISNNLDYIEDLNMGTSAQAPAGFVEMAVTAGLVAAARGKILR